MTAASIVVVQVVSWPLVAVLAWRAARGRIGWIAWPTAVAVASNAVMALDPAGSAQATLVSSTTLNLAIALLFCAYPDGRPWPRWVLAPVAVDIALHVADPLTGHALSAQWWWPVQFGVWLPCYVVALWLRYARRTDAAGRRSVRWVLTGLILMVAGYLVWWLPSFSLVWDMSMGWFGTILLALPWIGAAVGLLWPDAVVVDPVLRWSLTGGLFAAIVVGVVATVFALGNPAVPATGWTAAAIVAVGAVPLWTGISRLADRLVYGRRRDALTALGDLDELLAANHDAADVPRTVVHTLCSAIGVERCELRTAEDGLLAEEGASSSEIHRAAPESFAVAYRGETLADVRVWPRRGEQRLTPADRAVIARVCAYAGPALDGARALVELVDSRARTVIAREEERKRLRRDLHDDLAPTFAGLGLTASALERFAADGDPRAHRAAHDLALSLSDATRQLREIAYDLRPPALDDRGLVAALQDRMVVPGAVPAVTVSADLGDARLPAAVEAAAFRIAQEAVMNVRRHAAAATCAVSLAVRDGALEVRITDDGTGMPDIAPAGVGLRSMRERAEELGGGLRFAAGRGGGGTVVHVVLPLSEAAVAKDGVR